MQRNWFYFRITVSNLYFEVCNVIGIEAVYKKKEIVNGKSEIRYLYRHGSSN